MLNAATKTMKLKRERHCGSLHLQGLEQGRVYGLPVRYDRTPLERTLYRSEDFADFVGIVDGDLDHLNGIAESAGAFVRPASA